jgi:hypothetical protein
LPPLCSAISVVVLGTRLFQELEKWIDLHCCISLVLPVEFQFPLVLLVAIVVARELRIYMLYSANLRVDGPPEDVRFA